MKFNLSTYCLLFCLITCLPTKLNSNENSVKDKIIETQNTYLQTKLINELLDNIDESNLDSAIKSSTEIHKLSIITQNSEGIIKSSYKTGLYLYMKGNYNESTTWLHTCLSKAISENDSLHILTAYRTLTSNHNKQRNTDSLIFYSNKTISLAKTLNNNYELGAVYNDLGNHHLDLLENDTAMYYYHEALDIFNKLQDSIAIAVCYGNIANLYISEGDFENAKRHILIASEINKEYKNLSELSNNYNNLGIIYKETNMIDSALYYYNKSIKTNTKIKDFASNAIVYNNLGNLYTRNKQLDYAEIYFNKSLHLCDSLNIEVGKTYNFSGLGSLYFMKKDYAKTIFYLEKSIIEATKYNQVEFKLKSNEELYETYKILGDSEKALKHLEIFHNLHDSLINKEKQESIEKYKILFETKQRENLILAQKARYEELSKESELDRIKNQRLIIFLIVIVLLIGLHAIIHIRMQNNNREIKTKTEIIQNSNIRLSKYAKEIEEQANKLKEQNQQLNELTEFRNNLISTMVHDLKSPLNSVISLSELQPNTENTKHIHYAGINMLNLVSNILDVQKQEEASIKTKIEPINLIDIIYQAENELGLEIKLKNIQIKKHLKVVVMQADKSLLKRIFINLISNSIKYSENNSEITIESHNLEKENKTMLKITDHGEGIDPSNIKLLFKQYSNLNPKDLGMSYSSGIGLSFCKLATEAMGGDIDIESDLNNGTSVWFTLPNEVKKE